MSKPIKLESRRERRRKRDDKMWKDFKLRSFISDHWKTRPTNHEEWLYIMKEAIEHGIKIEDFTLVFNEVQQAQALQLVEKKKKQIKADAEMKRRNTPLARLIRNFPYRNTAKPYRRVIEEIAQTESIESLTQIRTQIVNSRPSQLFPTWQAEYADEQKTALLTWLNTIIDVNQPNEESPKKSLAKRIFNLT